MASVVDAVLGCSVFALAKTRDFDHGVDCVSWLNEEALSLLNEDVDHVVAALHCYHGLILLLLLRGFSLRLFSLFLLVAHNVSLQL